MGDVWDAINGDDKYPWRSQMTKNEELCLINYHWKYLPTGETGVRSKTEDELLQEFSHLSIRSFPRKAWGLFAVNRWNKYSDMWKYWTED